MNLDDTQLLLNPKEFYIDIYGTTRPIPPSRTEGFYGPFVTGSHAYGTPTDTSDVDLVIMTDVETKDFLMAFADGRESRKPHYALIMGKLNLICCVEPNQFEAWRDGTLRLIAEMPVTRERAIEVLKQTRKKWGVHHFE